MSQKFYYFNENILKKKPMTFSEFTQKSYSINIDLYNNNFRNIELVNQCLDIILRDNGRCEITTDNGGYFSIVSPNYRIAFNTLKSLGILVEEEKEES